MSKRKQKKELYNLAKLILQPATNKVNNKLNEVKIKVLKQEIARSQIILKEENKYLHLPIKNPNNQARRVGVLNARDKAMKKELKRLIKAEA